MATSSQTEKDLNGYMKWVKILFFISLLFGTVVSVTVLPGVTLYLHDFFLVLLLVYSFCIKTKQKHSAKLTPYILGFIAVSLLSLIINSNRLSLPDLGISSLYLIRWILYTGIYFMILRKQINTASWLIGLFGVGVSYGAIGLFQFFLYPDLRNLMYLGWDPHYYRLFSTILDPNFAGIIFVCTIFLGLYMYLQKKSKWILGISLIPFIALVLTFSRSSYLAFFVGSVALALLEKKRKEFIIGFVLFVVLFFAIPNPGRDLLHMDRMATSIARIENWQESLTLIQKSPIFGNGFNTLRYIQNQSPTDALVSHAGAGVDNSFLFILATTGVVGFGVYIWLLVVMTRHASHMRRLGSDARVLGHVVLASFVSLYIHSQFINSLFFPQVMIWMWILIGVVEIKLGEATTKVQRLR